MLKKIWMLFIAIVLTNGLSLVEAFSSDQEGAEINATEVLLIQEGHITGRSPSSEQEFSVGLLSEPGSQLYDEIYNGLVTSAAEINISKYNVTDVETIRQIYGEIVDDDSSLFYVTGGFSYYTIGGKITSILPVYSISGAELIAAQEEYRSNIESITSLVDPSWSPLEIALFLHDYLVCNYEYDETYSIYKANEFFKYKKGVCNAYTLAYQALLDEFGFERTRAPSVPMNHIWNIIKIDGEWYHVDLTWDDPVPDTLGYARHLFFLVSDTAIQEEERDHTGWTSSVACNSTKYDYYSWKEIIRPLVYLDGQWYAISTTGLASYDLCENNLQELLSLPVWRVWDNPSYIWGGKYSGLCKYGGELYYNSPESIYAYDPSSNTSRIVYSPDCTNGYIYGLRIDGNRVDYLISQGPNSTDIGNAEIRSYEIPRIKAGIRMEALPDKLVYEIGEVLNTEGMVVMLEYQDGSSDPIDDYAISGDLSGPGGKTITVSYESFTASFSITVCGLSIEDKGDGNYDAFVVLEAEEGGTTFLVSGYEVSGRMKALKALPFEYDGGFVIVQTTLTGIEEWSVLKVYFLDDQLTPKIESRLLSNN